MFRWLDRHRPLILVMLAMSLCFIGGAMGRAGSGGPFTQFASTLAIWISALVWAGCATRIIRRFYGKNGSMARYEQKPYTNPLERHGRPGSRAILCLVAMMLCAWVYAANMNDYPQECYVDEDFNADTVREWANPEPTVTTNEPGLRRQAVTLAGRQLKDPSSAGLLGYMRTASIATTSSWRDPFGVQHCRYTDSDHDLQISWTVGQFWVTHNVQASLFAYTFLFVLFTNTALSDLHKRTPTTKRNTI